MLSFPPDFAIFSMKLRYRLKNRFKKFLFDISAENAGLYTFFHRLFYKPKKGTLAEILDIYARETNHVTFLQVGANDGFFHDPLHKFIRMYKWEGVLLEPQPDVFEKFLSRLHGNTPGVHAVNAALSDQDGKKNIYKIAFSNSRWATGLTSFNRSALEEAIDSGHVERCAGRYGEALPTKKDEFIKATEIESISPLTLMERYKLERINWVQIDAEGYDFEVIKLINIAETKPHLIAFEHSHLSEADRRACAAHLATNGYSLIGISENTVAMRQPFGSLARFFDKQTQK